MKKTQSLRPKNVSFNESLVRITKFEVYAMSFLVTIPLVGWSMVASKAIKQLVEINVTSAQRGVDMMWLAIGVPSYFIANIIALFVAIGSGSLLVMCIVFLADFSVNVLLARKLVLGRLMHILVQDRPAH